MKSFFGTKIFFVALCLFCSLRMEAATYYVSPVKTVGVNAKTAESEYELIKSALHRSGQKVSASESGADFVLVSKLIQLGESLILQVEKKKGNDVVFATEMKTGQVEELDRITDRIVRAVIKESLASQEAKLDEVTKSESSKEENKFQARKHWQIGFGPSWGTHLDSKSTMANFKLAYAWQVKDFNLNFFWKFNSSITSSEPVGSIGILGLGGSYYFTQESTSPFVSLGLGVGGAERADFGPLVTNNSVTGFAVSVGGGYTFLRTSNVNFEVYMDMVSVLKQNNLGLPFVLNLGLGINF